MASLVDDKMLADFKAYMRITHKAEDPTLKMLLEQSTTWAMDTLTDAALDNPQTLELVFNRARYAFNDKLGDFNNDFQSDIWNRSINLYVPREVDWDGETTK